MIYYECPSCGDTDSFYLKCEAVASVSLEYIDAETGNTPIGPYSEPEVDSYDAEKIVGYHCYCGMELDKTLFDPAIRTAKMMDDLRAVLADIDELTVE